MNTLPTTPSEVKLQKEAFLEAQIQFSELADGVLSCGQLNTWVPISLLSYNELINPRKHVNQKSKDELRNSILSDGLLQPITVRLSHEHQNLELVLGNTRTEAIREIEGVLSIWATVVDVTDQTAKNMAGAENFFRANMSALEEADHVISYLNTNGNDENEACKRFGWSKTKLENRKALTKVGLKGRQALVNGTVNLGHCEILSTLNDQKQEELVAKIESDRLNVEQTKELVKKLERELASAAFDTAGCNGCPHNTSTVIDMFSTVAAGSICRNGACWREKTKAHITTIQSELEESYSQVKLDTQLVDGTFTIIASDGTNGIGDQQAKACTSCESFGCVIATREGIEGKVRKNICFDLSCHSEKKAKHSEIKIQAGDNSTPVDSTKSPQGAIQPTLAEKKRQIKPSTKPTKAVPKQISGKLEAYSKKILRSKAAQISASDQHLVRCMSVAAVVQRVEQSSFKEFNNLLPKAFQFSSHDKLLNALFDKSEAELGAIELKAVELILRSNSTESISALALTETTLMGEWKPTEEYLLNMPSKAAVSVVLEDSGFLNRYSDVKGEKQAKKLASLPIDQFRKEILEFDFDWSGYVPESLNAKTYLKD